MREVKNMDSKSVLKILIHPAFSFWGDSQSYVFFVVVVIVFH